MVADVNKEKKKKIPFPYIAIILQAYKHALSFTICLCVQACVLEMSGVVSEPYCLCSEPN